jgi:amidase
VDTPFVSATKLIRALRQKKIGALELLELYIKRVERYDGALNALPVRDFAAARKRANAFDRKGAKSGPLGGLPMTVKESFNVAGLATTWGLSEYRDNKPRTNAVAVERFVRAGGNIFAKSNVPVLLADWETANPVYGKTVNPWNHERTPGGSSGGSAAALAAGLTGLEAGRDIGGSIRNPAASAATSPHGACARWPARRCRA